jgi:hypothetical protein
MRTLLVVALVVISGLTYKVVVLGTTTTTSGLQRASRTVDYFDLSRRFAEEAAAAEPGARLDHRGENNAKSTSLDPPSTR